MKILFVYPQYPDTFWSFRHALKFISKKAANPPLGLLTVAAMLPSEWEQRLIDLNVGTLYDSDILWADYVFLGGMAIQLVSARSVIQRCHALGKPVVAGGPLFTSHPEDFDDVEHLVLNEAEVTLPAFLRDLEAGSPTHCYRSEAWADMRDTPAPRWDLIDFSNYATMNLQYSRGCPYDCEFCDITVLFGRRPRTKSRDHLLGELESLYNAGWRGNVFFVDDNFIGNKAKLKKEILPAVREWMQERNYPFSLSTEASINLADDDELMSMMTGAGFEAVFVGIESPNEESLMECGKVQNKNRDLVAAVRKMQHFGFEVQGGFIVGFDSDPVSIFDHLSSFIQESGIVTAMVGLLNAPRGTRLHTRLAGEGRLLQSMSGDNTDCSMNFIPKMNPEILLHGYHRILSTIYAPREYYARVKKFLKQYRPAPAPRRTRFEFNKLMALIKSTIILGVIGRERIQYWKLFFWSLVCRPRLFPCAITFAIYGYHFRKIVEQYVS